MEAFTGWFDAALDWIHRAFVGGQLRMFFYLPAVLFLALPAILGAYVIYQRKRRWRVRYPITAVLGRVPRVQRIRRPSRHIPIIVRLLVISLIVVAAMRPQMGRTKETVTTRGIDIMLTLDISWSMLAEDFEPNRAEAAKTVLGRFVRRNTNDRIGLVVFAGMAFTQCPLTTDTTILEEFINQVRVGDVLRDGTAIGDAILTTVARFPDEDVPSRIVILLTDGEHNVGRYGPLDAARVAARQGVRIYTIGVGSEGGAPIPDPTMPGTYIRDIAGHVRLTKLDEDTLRDVARLTGGRYFRATDEQALADIYDEIAQLETHEIESHRYTSFSELFQYVVAAALVLLVLELAARNIWGRVLP